MGKSFPKVIKSKANVLLKEIPESLNDSFANNKTKINELKLPFSKWTTNIMSGYITRHHKKIIKAEKKKEDARKKTENVMKEAPGFKRIQPMRTERTETPAEEVKE